TGRERCSCRSTACAPSSDSRRIEAGRGPSAKPPISLSRDRAGSCRSSRRARATKRWRTHSSGWSIPWMRSAAATFRPRLTTCIAAERARSPASAGRITSVTSEPMLPFDSGVGIRDSGLDLPDAAARQIAVDPTQNVVLEASAGTGKTRVLVERYVNLLRAGVEPDHILAITFTRKAAAEMRQRIIDRLKEASRLSEFDMARWRELKERLGDIAISTIDAFCLSLLREFPLEADVDPGFDLAADTDVPRLIDESLDRAFRICRAVAKDDDDVALVFAQIGERRLRSGIAALLDRRLLAPTALA